MTRRLVDTITKKYTESLLSKLRQAHGNKQEAAKLAEMNPTTFAKHLRVGCRKYGLKIPKLDVSKVKRSSNISDEDLVEAWNAYERYGYNATATAEALGVRRQLVDEYVKKAMHKFGFEKRNLGRARALTAQTVEPPKKGEVKRYIITCAQNNTKLHDPTWASLINLAKHYDAEIKVGTFTYAPNADGSEKRGREKKTSLGWNVSDRWYDPRIEPYIADDYEQLAPGLVWCGHHNILPTVQNPLASKESITGRASGIFPHTRMEMRPIATTQEAATKFIWSTGAVTLRNYLQKNAGIMAEFYHCFGGLLVEVDDGGNWWVRQLNADSEGVIYDFEIYSTPEGVFENEDGAEACVYGDIHWPPDPLVEEATWGEGGLVDILRPRYNVIHDLLNFNPSHHNRKDPHKMFALTVRGENIVWNELKGGGGFLDKVHRVYENGEESEEIVVDSNHHRHFDRYLKEVDWRYDLVNARTILRMNDAWLEAIEERRESEFLAYEHALRSMGFGKHARFMNVDSEDPDKLSLVVCPANGGGVEIGGLHGHDGPNGAKGTPTNLSKFGRKNVVADKHSPGIYGGTYVAGMSGRLRQGYNRGPGSWAPAHVPVYPNGKRQVLVGWVVKGKMQFRAEAA